MRGIARALGTTPVKAMLTTAGEAQGGHHRWHQRQHGTRAEEESLEF